MRKCLNCERVLLKKSQKKFCSKSCSAKYNNPLRANPLPLCVEPSCVNSVLGRGRKFCTRACYDKYREDSIISPWLAGKEVKALTELMKKHVRIWDHNRCVLCGQGATWNGSPITLQVDHIDGNWKNNRPDNLRTLCPNCHTQTDNYGSKNSGQGRKHKRR